MGGKASTMVMSTGPAGRGQAPANFAQMSSDVKKMGTCGWEMAPCDLVRVQVDQKGCLLCSDKICS